MNNLFSQHIEPTEEQLAIIKALPIESLIKVNAFAGTGKTSMLQMLTNFYPEKKFLYLAYNKSMQVEAQTKFCNNVEVKTVHAFAYSYIAKYTLLNLREIKNYNAKDFSTLFNVDYKKGQDINTAFSDYCNYPGSINTKDINWQYIDKTCKLIDDNKFSPSFDYILKKFLELIEGGITIQNYDTVLLDEAQDSTDIIIDIFLKLKANHKVLVGDRHQQIYSFKNSKNAMTKIIGKEYALTKTFRFPKNIANYSNLLLERFKGEALSIKSDILPKSFEEISENEHSSIGYISRGNSLLIEKMLELNNNNQSFKTIRSPKEIFKTIKDIGYFLKKNIKEISPQNDFLRQLSDKQELIKYIELTNDFQLDSILRIFKIKFDSNLEKVIELESIANNYFKQKTFIKNILTTAHSAKGLEFDCTVILSDYFSFEKIIKKSGYDSYEEYVKSIDNNNHRILDEFNLFYVALTRTKSSTIIEDYNLNYLEKKNWKKILNENIEKLGEQKSTLKTTSHIVQKTKISEENNYSKQKNIDEYMIVLDFETNSNNSKDVLEVGALKICKDGNNFVVLDTFHRYYHSKYEANPFALEVHKLSPAKIKKLRKDVDYAKYFADDKDFVIFCQGSSTLIAHNITFELRHISDLVSFENLFCTMKENKQIVKALNVKGHFKNPRLDEVCCFYNIKLHKDSYHSAIYDVTKTLEILNKMNNSSNEYDIIKHTLNERIKAIEELKFIQRQKEQKKIKKEEIKNENKQKSIQQTEKHLFWKGLSCPHCFSSEFKMKGKRQNLDSFTQRFQCNHCMKIFTKRIDEEGRPIEEIIPKSSNPIIVNLKNDNKTNKGKFETEKIRLQPSSIADVEINEKPKHVSHTQKISEAFIESKNENFYPQRNKNVDFKIKEKSSRTIQQRFFNLIDFFKSLF